MSHAKLDIPALLGRLPLFSGLSPSEVERIAEGARELHARKGDILFHKGDPNQGFHLLLGGQVKLAFVSAQGNEKVVEVIRAGQSFGEAIMFMETPYIVFAEALEDVHMLHIAKQSVFAELDRDPKLARKMLASMAVRLHQLMADLEAYSLHSGKERIIGYLLRELPDNASGTAKITLQVTKGVIASRLNLTQEHFSRMLHELAAEGLIAVRGRNIDIPDLERLRGHHA